MDPLVSGQIRCSGNSLFAALACLSTRSMTFQANTDTVPEVQVVFRSFPRSPVSKYPQSVLNLKMSNGSSVSIIVNPVMCVVMWFMSNAACLRFRL